MINEPSVFWALLIAVSVYDVEKHRIPNKILILFLFFYFLSMFNSNYTFDRLCCVIKFKDRTTPFRVFL
ncbi:hypothetical protein AB6E62_04560, partial [Vibrio sp. 10N.247.311.26]